METTTAPGQSRTQQSSNGHGTGIETGQLVKHLIGGQWVESVGGGTFTSQNPATGETLAELSQGTAEDANRAVEAARKAFESWRLTPAPKRGEILFRAGQLLIERKEEIARLMTQEMGKVLAEARGDVQEAIDMTFYMAGEGRRLAGEVVPSELPNKWAMTTRDPLGVVAAITPWNFPVAIPSWKIMPALVAGNTVVIKPASDTPLCAIALIKVLEDAGVPAGVINLVMGPGSTVGTALLEHPDVALISFTGSTDAGNAVAVEAARRLKRVSLEMGGKNAIIVMDDADLDLALEGILWSAFGTSGQRCTAASRVIVHRAVQKELEDRLVARMEKLRLGNGLESTTDVGPVINKSQQQRIHKMVQEGQKAGTKLVTGGKIADEGDLAHGAFYTPSLFTDAKWDDMVAQEEIFGPVTTLVPVDSLDEAIRVNNHTKYGLSSSIYTANVNRAFQAMRDITTGIVYINAGTIGAEIQVPFGGTRGTGNGHREAGQAGLDTFTEWKTIYVDYSGKLQRAQIDITENPAP
jgi:aldehyde dehydrogenase (NAD+)